jgi:DNA polymerase I-like protein with 3'-5' exonuclease and polymerase domains
MPHPEFIALDTECTGPDFVHGCQPFFVSTMDSDGCQEWWRFDVNPYTRLIEHYHKSAVRLIRKRLQNAGKIVFHNATFDIQALNCLGITWTQDLWDKTHDTLLSAHVLDSSEPHGLKYLGKKYLGISTEDEQILLREVAKARAIAKKRGYRRAEVGDPHFPTQSSGFLKMDSWLPATIARLNFQEYPPTHLWHTVLDKYACLDAERTALLFYLHQETLLDEGLLEQYERERQLLSAVYSLELRGVSLRRRACRRERHRYRKIVLRSELGCQQIARSVGKPQLNVRSHPQIREFLYQTLKLPEISWTDSGAPSTDAKVLQELFEDKCSSHSLAHDFLQELINFRKYTTAENYLRNYVHSACYEHPGWVLHPNFNQVGTRTTRFSCSNPNAHNVGKGESWGDGDPEASQSSQKEFQLRKVFGPHPGRVWVSMDYSNQELRIAAYSAQEQELIQAFESGVSVHLIIAQELFGSWVTKESEVYDRVKSGNFAMIYGATVGTVDATYGLEGGYQKVMSRFQNLSRSMEEKVLLAEQYGYITTLGGYHLGVDLSDRTWKQKPYNYFIQGSAGEMMKEAIRSCHAYLEQEFNEPSRYPLPRPPAFITMTIHDELVFDLDVHLLQDRPQTVDCLRQLMESAAQWLGIPVPVSVSLITHDWSQKTPWQPTQGVQNAST